MRRTMIAIATAGILISGSAVAATTVTVPDSGFVPVQYSTQYSNQADRWDDRSVSVNEREARIRARIDRGMSDGRITHREARRLLRELGAVEAKERTYMADGRLNRREEAQLNRDLDVLAQNVRAQMRDDERRDAYGNPYSYNDPYRR